MSAIMGAGKKESDNTFTGLLLGDLPKVENENKTGLLGYEHGEQSYGIFDDGTMFLGKSSRAQIKFDGSTGTIQNNDYDASSLESYIASKGMLIDLDGVNQQPFINMKAGSGAGVYIGTGGGPDSEDNPNNIPPVKNLYFRIKAPVTQKDTDNGVELIHIGKGSQYLQTINYNETNQTGLKLDLSNGSLKSYDELTIQGGKPGEDNSILISTKNQTIASLVGQKNKTN